MRLLFSNNMPKYMRVFAHFAAREIGLDRLRGDVTIVLKPQLEGNCFGLCWGDNREAEVHIASRQWGMTISKEDKLKTLAHELVHAKQYLKRELQASDVDGYVSRWRGRNLSYDPRNENEMPWEKQAYAVEQPIFDKWYKLTGYK